MRICDAVALVAMGGRCRCREANQLRQQLHRLLLFSAGSERRVSAERKAYGVRLVFFSRLVRHVKSVLALYSTITLTMVIFGETMVKLCIGHDVYHFG